MPELERFSYSTDIVEKYKNWFADADILKHLYPNTPFISNPSEARLLASPAYQDKLAQGIANGIEKYFEEHLPQHMLLGQ